MKSLKIKLDKEIPVPSLPVDPSHHVKVVSKHIFSIVNDGEYQQCGCTKGDAIRPKKYWGYMIKNNRNKSLE